MQLKTNKIQKSIKRLRKFLKQKPKNPAPEHVHDIRTSTRRLESSLDAIHLGKKRVKKRLERNLAAVRKRLGKVRDMDVLTADAMSVAAKTSERECLVELIEHLGTKRAKYAKKLRNTASDYGPSLRSDLARISKRLDGVARQNGREGERFIEPGSLQDESSELLSSLEQPKRLNRSNLHPYRLKVKELRYLLQLLDQDRLQDFVRSLGKAKDAIGEWHDWEELALIAGSVVDGGAQSKLVKELKNIAREKFEEALSITNGMRKAYTGAKRRQLLPN